MVATRLPQISHDPPAIEGLFVDLFVETHETSRKQIYRCDSRLIAIRTSVDLAERVMLCLRMRTKGNRSLEQNVRNRVDRLDLDVFGLAVQTSSGRPEQNARDSGVR